MAQCNFQPRVRRRHWRTPAVLLCLLLVPLARGASGVDVEIHGVDDEIRDNVLAYLSFERYKKGGVELTTDTVERLHNRVEREVDAALRPFGYYEPQVQSRVDRQDNGEWRVVLDITPGEPVLVDHIDVRVDGPGEADPLFQSLLRRLPLHSGDLLQHKQYEELKHEL
jgi:translocation and assembly module TamA